MNGNKRLYVIRLVATAEVKLLKTAKLKGMVPGEFD